MSLLMDALRRAEQEKKQAAKEKQAQQGAAGSESGNNTESAPVSEALEELGATVKLDRLPLPIAEKQKNASNATGAIADSLNDLNVDFEKTSPRLKRDYEEPSDGSATDTYDFSIDDAAQPDTTPTDPDFSINAEYATEKFDAALSLEPMQAAAPDGDGSNTTDATDETSPPASKLPGVTQDATVVAASDPLLALNASEQTLETSSGQTAVAANTVFEAGSSGISKRVILWTLALGIAVIGLLVVSGVYYFQQTPTMRALPAPVANIDINDSQGVANAAASATPVNPVAAPDPTPAVADTSVTALNEPRPQQAPRVEAQETLNSAEAELAPPVESSVETVESRTALSPSDVKPAAVAPVGTAMLKNTEAPVAAQVTTVPTVNTKRLSIARSLRAEKANDKVSEAYSAYQAGNFDVAKALYEEALEIRAQDTNALNGLAALALRDGNRERAHALYSRVLKLDPNNGTAATAIFQIEGGVGNRVTESQLKLMLDEGSDPGAINFALGALYARHERWNDAQLAYFEAVRHRPNNPDYLFNLAVSLDQIGQRKAALDYYQKALTAADDSSAGFDQAQVLSRIQVISAQSASGVPQ